MAEEVAGIPIVPLIVAGVGAIAFVSLIGGGRRRTNYADTTLESMRITTDALKEFGRQGVENAAIQADLAKSRSADKTSITLATIQSSENLAINERENNTARYRVYQSSQDLQSQLRNEFQSFKRWIGLEKFREEATTKRTRIEGDIARSQFQETSKLERARLANERYAISQGVAYQSQQLNTFQDENQQNFILGLLSRFPDIADTFVRSSRGISNIFGGYGGNVGGYTSVGLPPQTGYGYSPYGGFPGGGWGGAAGGALGGAASGAVLGSVVPGIGTALGAGLGAAAGGAAGGGGGLS